MACGLLCILFTGCRQQPQPNHNGEAFIQLIPVKVNTGWGYEIYIDGKLYIRQEYIPVISGRHAFATKQNAISAGKLVFKKLQAGKIPMLTVNDLRSINVIP